MVIDAVKESSLFWSRLGPLSHDHVGLLVLVESVLEAIHDYGACWVQSGLMEPV